MAESSILNLAKTLQQSKDYRSLRGLCYIDKEPKQEYLQLPSFSECQKDKVKFIDMFDAFY